MFCMLESNGVFFRALSPFLAWCLHWCFIHMGSFHSHQHCLLQRGEGGWLSASTLQLVGRQETVKTFVCLSRLRRPAQCDKQWCFLRRAAESLSSRSLWMYCRYLSYLEPIRAEVNSVWSSIARAQAEDCDSAGQLSQLLRRASSRFLHLLAFVTQE